MQTFITSTVDFSETAKVLDNKRLNKQALEGWQVLMTLLELNPDGSKRTVKGWANHPAVKMWRGHEVVLHEYIQAMVNEWISRGYKSTIGEKARATITQAHELGIVDPAVISPAWMKDLELYEKVASSHRGSLLNKNYQWYSQLGWPEDTGTEPETYMYVWPNTDGTYLLGEPRSTR
jgi:hypothetical protein